MKFLFALLMTLATLAIGMEKVHAEDDLFDIGKSDTSIKPFVFPKSMTVIQDCYPDEGGCIYLNPAPGMSGLDKVVVGNSRYLNEALNNKKAIKKYLVRLDPSRIAPSTRGKDHKAGSISNELDLSKKVLKKLGKQFDVDFIFVFRRTIFHLPPQFIRTEGRIYLVRQNKLLVVPSNDQTLKLDIPGSHEKLGVINQKGLELDVPGFHEKLGVISQKGLEQLGKDARKVVMSHKYEKRRSNY